MKYEIYPVTPDRWNDLTQLFGERGGTEGCWCMFWRKSSEEFQVSRGTVNKQALEQLISADIAPGLLAYDGNSPVGWCSVGPRENFGRIQRSPTLKPVDNTLSVWSVPCFFIDRQHRHMGVASELLEAAVDFAQSHGAQVIEGYPSEGKVENAFAYTGVPIMFRRLGFEVGAQRGKRTIMRRRFG